MLSVMQGIILRPKFSRGGHIFEVPVMLSPSVRDSHVLLAAYILPPLLAYVTKSWIVLPLKKRAKVKKVDIEAVHFLMIRISMGISKSSSLLLLYVSRTPSQLGRCRRNADIMLINPAIFLASF